MKTILLMRERQSSDLCSNSRIKTDRAGWTQKRAKPIWQATRNMFLSTLVIGTSLLAGCSSLLPADLPPPTLYSFDNAQSPSRNAITPKTDAPTLILSAPRAAAGFDTRQMIYVRQPHKLEHFRQNQWVDSPAAMLSPLVAAALEASGTFSAVLQSPTSVPGQFRLDLEIVRLQHEFFSTPSRVHFTLRAHLLNVATRQVVAGREFDALVPAKSDDPYGGVVAANQAVRMVLADLADFCSESIATLPLERPAEKAD